MPPEQYFQVIIYILMASSLITLAIIFLQMIYGERKKK